MKKNSILQVLLLTGCAVLISVLALVVGFVAFIDGAIKNHAEAGDMLSIYEQTKYDFIVASPSDEQIAMFTADASTEKVVPYYQTLYATTVGKEEVELTIVSIDHAEDREFTEFSSERLIRSAEKEGNILYIDYQLSSRYGLKIGDQIGSGVMTFTIAGIYQSYRMNLAFSPTMKSLLEVDKSSGVYIKAADKAAVKTLLEDYKPLAALKDREEFTDEEAYQNYLDNFYGRDYSTLITEKSDGYAEAKETRANMLADAKKNYLVSGVVMGVILLAGTLSTALVFLKKIKTEVVNGGSKSVAARYTLAAGVSLLTFIAGWLIGISVARLGIRHFIGIGTILSAGYLGLVLPVILLAVGYVANRLLTYGYREKKGTQKTDTEEK